MILKWSISLSIKIIVFIDFFAVAIVIPLIQTYFREAGIDTKLFVAEKYLDHKERLRGLWPVLTKVTAECWVGRGFVAKIE